MGVVIAGAEHGGVGFLCVGTVLCCDGTGSPYVWVVDVGYLPVHWKDNGRLPQQGGLRVDWSSVKEDYG